MVDWTTFIAAIFGSSVISVLVSSGLASLSKRSAVKTRNRHIALILANHLEAYSSECVNVLFGDGRPFDCYDPPAPFGLPDFDYTAFDSRLFHQVLVLPRMVKESQESIRFHRDLTDPNDPEDVEEAYLEVHKLAWHSLKLARRIRKEHKLPKYEPTCGIYTVEHALNEKLRKPQVSE